MKTLNVAIIGQGRSGRDIHGTFFKSDQSLFRVVAVVEELEVRRTRAAEEFGCAVYSDYKELFVRTDIDLVVNASFSYQHAEITVALLNHGFHVLCEKPCAKTPEDVQRMMDAAEKNGKMFAIFQQSRFAPYFEQVQQVLDSGVLGRAVQISISFNGYARRWDWQTCQDFVAGNLYNTGPHPLDQALQLLNCEGMPEIFCKMESANAFGDAEDYVKLLLSAPNRPLIDLEISSCDAFPSFTYKIQGTRGGLTGTQTEMTWKYFFEEEAAEQKLIRTPLMDANAFPLYCSEKLIWTEERWSGDGPRTFTYAVKKFYRMIYHHLVNGTPLTVTPHQVKQQIAVIQRCHELNPMPAGNYSDTH